MMIKALTRCTLVALVLFSSAAAAEPIKLKLAFPTSDRAELYLYAIKPFVDAVNTEANGLIEIEVYFSGVLGGSPPQPQLVLDGVADMALIVPGQSQLAFPDDAVLELPGLFHNKREATLAYAGLIRANALRGYEDFFVIGAFSTGPGNINSRKRLTSLSDLKGMKISATSMTEATVLERLGAVSNVLPLPRAMDAISAGIIDGSATAPTALAVFGIGRVTTYHYLLPTSGGARLALVMNRRKLEGLPEQAQSVIRKYSGEWMATRFVAHWQLLEKEELELIKSNARRIMTFPSPVDSEAAQAVFQSVNDEWAAKSPRNLELLTMVEKELAKIRSTPEIADVPMALQSSPN
jgi:TRAP-type C4-dicarboxylate transport system substrate-binding protein